MVHHKRSLSWGFYADTKDGQIKVCICKRVKSDGINSLVCSPKVITLQQESRWHEASTMDTSQGSHNVMQMFSHPVACVSSFQVGALKPSSMTPSDVTLSHSCNILPTGSVNAIILDSQHYDIGCRWVSCSTPSDTAGRTDEHQHPLRFPCSLPWQPLDCSFTRMASLTIETSNLWNINSAALTVA